MTGGRGSRDKGAGGELEVLDLVRANGWPRATRNFASGAAGNSDIAHGPASTVIEVKRAERLRLQEWWRQVERDAWHAGPGILPLLAVRWNRGPWLAVTELDEMLALLAHRERG